MDTDGAAFVHAVVEAAKLAFADREAWYGDPDFVDVPLEALLGEGYNAARRRLIGDDASLDLRLGCVNGPGAAARRPYRVAGPRQPWRRRHAGRGRVYRRRRAPD